MTPSAADHAAFLLAHFNAGDHPDAERIRFAVSDGPEPLDWTPLRGGRPIFRSDEDHRAARDPFLVRTSAGFVVLATDFQAWPTHDWETAVRRGSRSIVVWESPDLVEWSAPRLVEVAPESVGNVWAPKAFWSAQRNEWLVFWSSAIYPAGDDRTVERHQCIMKAGTRDFRTFSPAEIALDRGTDTIDATFLETGMGWFRFSVDHQEALGAGRQASAITVELGTTLEGHFTAIANGVGLPDLEHGEGPAVACIDAGTAWLLIDEFGGRGYQLFESKSPLAPHWRHRADAILPPGARHGSLLSITAAERDRLIARNHWS